MATSTSQGSCPFRARGLELRDLCQGCSGFPATGQLRVKRGDTLLREGEEADALHLVVSGMLRETRTNDDGRELDTRIAGPGSVLGVESLDRKSTLQCSVVSLTRGRVCRIPIDQVRARLARDPRAALALVDILRTDIQVLRDQLRRVTMRSAEHRVADLLGELLADVPRGTWHELQLGRAELAALCGLDRTTVSRALHRLVARGEIELHGRRIRRIAASAVAPT